MGHHSTKRISWGLLVRSLNQCAWGSITFEETVLGDTVDTAPLGFFLHYLFWSFLSNLVMEVQEVLFTKRLEFCPRCNAKLKVSSDGRTIYCIVCKNWTKVGPIKRRDSIFFDWFEFVDFERIKLLSLLLQVLRFFDFRK